MNANTMRKSAIECFEANELSKLEALLSQKIAIKDTLNTISVLTDLFGAATATETASPETVLLLNRIGYSPELDYHSILQRTFSDWGFRQ